MQMIDPQVLPEAIFTLHIIDALRGADDVEEAEERIKARFTPVPEFSIKRREDGRFAVLIKQFPNGNAVTIVDQKRPAR